MKSDAEKRDAFNEAQELLLKLGLDPMMVVSWSSGPNPSFRKKGPGRKHQQGKRRER